ncbi:MAG: hypothetical protein R3E68_11895 [Burkholderiaceae bacterium]
MLLLAGMVLDAPSILLIFVPLLIPVANRFRCSGPGVVRRADVDEQRSARSPPGSSQLTTARIIMSQSSKDRPLGIAVVYRRALLWSR